MFNWANLGLESGKDPHINMVSERMVKMDQITFEVDGNKTFFSCGCETEVIGENFIISPCSLDCEVYKYCIEHSREKGNIIMYNVEKEHIQ